MEGSEIRQINNLFVTRIEQFEIKHDFIIYLYNDKVINANLRMYSIDCLSMYSFDNKLHNIPEVECYVYEN